MHIIFELLFDTGYLVAVFWMGCCLLRQHRSLETGKLFGAMALVLGAGDVFHLLPRMYGLLGPSPAIAALGFGKLATSITSTVFYLLLYLVFKRYYKVETKAGILVWCMAVLRVFLCLMPQNKWFSPEGSFFWGIIRNVPFLILGIAVAALFRGEEKKREQSPFRMMPVGIGLSFTFYIPVVLLVESFPTAGMLMMPKTVVYLWMLSMAFRQGHKRT